jgi:hypothetical protein
VNGVVTGWAGGSTIVAAPDLATNLAPFANSSNSITPTFTWTYPPSASSFTYQFTITDDSGDTYWTIPANNSNLSGFPSTVTQIVWGTDPTGDASLADNCSGCERQLGPHCHLLHSVTTPHPGQPKSTRLPQHFQPP